MTTDKPAMRMRITVVKVIDCHRVQGKPYDRMEFLAGTDKTDKPITFVTFKPEIIDAIFEGNSFPADIVVETNEGKTESKVIKAYLPDSREIYENTRTVIMSVSDKICAKVEVPQDIIDSHWELVRKCQKEGLK